MTVIRNVQLLVEGFHDRAFVRGWLAHRGWRDPGERQSGRVPVTNPVTQKIVSKGNYAFVAPGGTTFVEVTPQQGARSVLGSLVSRCGRAAPPDPDELVLVLDADHTDYREGYRRREDAVENALAAHTPERVLSGGWRLSSGLHVALWVWGTPTGVDAPGVPATHCLERLVAVACADTYPRRAHAVQGWLDTRPEPAGANAKAIAWSWMAGWYSDQGCDAFLRHAVWTDLDLATCLSKRLDATTAGDTLRRLESAPVVDDV
jgi:hypothetical protein